MSSNWLKRRMELEQWMGADVIFRGHHEEPEEGEPVVDELDEKLAAIEKEVENCTKCDLHKTRTQGVFAKGKSDAEVMMIGEAPGADEDEQGLPFVGRAGKLLDQIILAMGFGVDDIYITNILKSRPPENRDPKKEEIKACWPYLEEQIQLIQPEVIITLGKPAANTLLDRNSSMGDMQGRWFSYEGIPVMSTYHPAYLLRAPSQKEKVWEDLKKVVSALHGEDDPLGGVGEAGLGF